MHPLFVKAASLVPQKMQDPLANVRSEKVPMIYFNGLVIGFGNADFFIRVRLDNIDQMELKTSYTVMKTMAQKLTEAVAEFEKVTEHTIMTTEDVAKRMANSKMASMEADES